MMLLSRLMAVTQLPYRTATACRLSLRCTACRLTKCDSEADCGPDTERNGRRGP